MDNLSGPGRGASSISDFRSKGAGRTSGRTDQPGTGSCITGQHFYGLDRARRVLVKNIQRVWLTRHYAGPDGHECFHAQFDYAWHWKFRPVRSARGSFQNIHRLLRGSAALNLLLILLDRVRGQVQLLHDA